MLAKGTITAQKLASVIGRMSAACLTVLPAPPLHSPTPAAADSDSEEVSLTQV